MFNFDFYRIVILFTMNFTQKLNPVRMWPFLCLEKIGGRLHIKSYVHVALVFAFSSGSILCVLCLALTFRRTIDQMLVSRRKFLERSRRLLLVTATATVQLPPLGTFGGTECIITGTLTAR